MAQLARLDLAEFKQRYWQHRIAYDRGQLSGAEYWERVVGKIGDDDSTNAITEKLIAADCASWTDYREDIWQLAAQFRKSRGPTAILSNAVPEVSKKFRADKDLAHFFDATILSYEVGCIKPEARIYEICVNALGVAPQSTLFVDDRLENLDGAARLGIQVFHFTGDQSVDDLRSRIERDT